MALSIEPYLRLPVLLQHLWPISPVSVQFHSHFAIQNMIPVVWLQNTSPSALFLKPFTHVLLLPDGK